MVEYKSVLQKRKLVFTEPPRKMAQAIIVDIPPFDFRQNGIGDIAGRASIEEIGKVAVYTTSETRKAEGNSNAYHYIGKLKLRETAVISSREDVAPGWAVAITNKFNELTDRKDQLDIKLNSKLDTIHQEANLANCRILNLKRADDANIHFPFMFYVDADGRSFPKERICLMDDGVNFTYLNSLQNLQIDSLMNYYNLEHNDQQRLVDKKTILFRFLNLL